MSFLTDTQVKQAVADFLKVDVTQLPAYFTGSGRVIEDAHVAAYQEIKGRLLARGFTAAQVDLWDRGAEFEKHLTIYWATINGGGTTAMDDRFLKQYDRRNDLNSVLVSVLGVFITPGDTPGTIGIGAEDTSNDLFSLDQFDDRRGKPTRW